MPKVYGQQPYQDDYDPSTGYTKLLALPGRAEQAREFTQIQSIFHEQLKRIGDTILRDGSIVEGCSLVIQGNQATLTSGKVYLNGLIHDVKGATLTILGVGNETIGAKIIETIVTEFEDPTFRDPAQGYENYGQAGAHRVKEEVQLVVNDTTASVLYRLQNGALINDEVKPDLDIVQDVLAKRTYDESGNYKVFGLEVMDRAESDKNHIYLSLSEGRAYIRGYEINKPTAVRVPLEYARDTRQVLNEPKTYNTAVNKYKLNNTPAKELTHVKCIVLVDGTITRGNIVGGLDYLTSTPVVDVVSVVQGDITYVKGVDFQLSNDAIDWSLGGKAPSPGTQYTVTWKYNKSMVIGTDVKLTKETNGTSYIEFISGGSKPVNGTSFDVDYSFYLARKDLVCITDTGSVEIIKGKSDILRLVNSPSNTDDKALTVASVLVHPDSTKVNILNFSVTRLSMSDLFSLVQRIDSLEYNQAISDLDKEAMDGEPATDLQGVFTDGFIGFSKADVAHSEFDTAIDMDAGEMTLPNAVSTIQLTPNTNTYETRANIRGRIISAPYSEVAGISQMYATEVMLVNPYAVYDRMLLIKLNPAVDNWIETSTIVINQTQVKVENFNRWWYYRGQAWADAERRRWEAMFGTSYTDDWSNKGLNTATKVEVSQKVVLDEAVMYMRRRTVQVTGHNFVPLQDNVKCYFDETEVPLTPVAPSTAGTQSGTIRADIKGTVTGTFMIPPNVPCGSKEVKLVSLSGQGSATYTAQGRRKVIENTVLTTKYVAKLSDPLAQAFVFNEDTMLTSVGLYFASKDTGAPVNIQIRNMVNGYPGRVCYAEMALLPEQVSVSSKGTDETKVTFDEPVYCRADTEYCICILSDSNLYSMFIATLGGTDLNTKEVVNRQPYNDGTLFSSSNASTWTAHQTQDLKFKVYRANYTEDGVVIYNDVTGVSIDRLVIASDTLNPSNSEVDWMYSVNSGVTWSPIETYVDRDLPSLANKVSVKAILKRKNKLSPLIASDATNFIGFQNRTSARYVSKNVVLEDNYTTLRVIVEFALPSGTTGKVYYSTDGNGAQWTELLNPTVTVIDQEFSKYEFKATGLSAKNYRVKVVLSTNSPVIRPRARKLMSIMKC